MINFVEEALVRWSVGPSVRRSAIGQQFCSRSIAIAPSARRSVGDCSIYLSVEPRIGWSVGRSVGLPFSESVRMLNQSVGRWVGLPFSESVRMLDQSVSRSVGSRKHFIKEGKMAGREGAGMEGKERAGRKESRMRRGS